MRHARYVLPALAVSVLTGAALLVALPAASADVAAPTVVGVAARTGPTSGGRIVTVAGSHLSGVTRVAFGAVPGTDVQVISDSRLLVTAPAHPAGSVYVHVTTAGGTTPGTAASRFAYVPSPAPLVVHTRLVPHDPRFGPASLSCASRSFCAAIVRGEIGNRLEYGVMTYDGVRWSKVRVFRVSQYGDGFLTGVSCTVHGGRMCMVVGGDGFASRFDGHRWSRTKVDYRQLQPYRSLMSVSCPGTHFCLAVDGKGYYVRYDGKRWTKRRAVAAGHPYLTDVSCATTHFCAATITDDGGTVVMYVNGAWQAPRSVGVRGSIGRIDCPSSTFCMAAGDFDASLGDYVVWTGRAWSVPQVTLRNDPATVVQDGPVCTSPTFCIVVSERDDSFGYFGSLLNGSSADLPTPDGAKYSCWASYQCMRLGDFASRLLVRGA